MILQHSRPATWWRDFTPEGPDQLWVADNPAAVLGRGWLYMAVVIDAAAASSGGRWPSTCAPSWCSMPSTWLLPTADRRLVSSSFRSRLPTQVQGVVACEWPAWSGQILMPVLPAGARSWAATGDAGREPPALTGA